VGTAGVDAEQAAAAQLEQRRSIEHLHLEVVRRADLARDLGHALRRQEAGRGVAQVAGEQAGLGQKPTALGTPADGISLVGAGDQGQLRQPYGGRAGVEGVVAVARQQHTLDDHTGSTLRRERARIRQVDGQPLVRRRSARERGGGVAECCRVQLGGVANPDRDQGRAVLPGQHQHLADVALKAGAGKRRSIEAELAPDGAAVGHRHRQDRGARRH
jgi:hypothetical protein